MHYMHDDTVPSTHGNVLAYVAYPKGASIHYKPSVLDYLSARFAPVNGPTHEKTTTEDYLHEGSSSCPFPGR